MRKRLITYFFIVCSLCIHVCGLANPIKAKHPTANTYKCGYTTTLRTFTFKKARLILLGYPDGINTGISFQHHRIRALNSLVSYYTTEQNFFLLISCHVQGGVNNKKEVERVLKDHLLYIFPSHYFW